MSSHTVSKADGHRRRGQKRRSQLGRLEGNLGGSVLHAGSGKGSHRLGVAEGATAHGRGEY